MPPHYCPEGTEKAPCASVAERVSYQSMVPVWQRESDSPVYGATSHWWQAGGCIMLPKGMLPLELSQRKKNRKITVCICDPLEPPPALTGKTSAFDVVMKKCPAERSGVWITPFHWPQMGISLGVVWPWLSDCQSSFVVSCCVPPGWHNGTYSPVVSMKTSGVSARHTASDPRPGTSLPSILSFTQVQIPPGVSQVHPMMHLRYKGVYVSKCPSLNSVYVHISL